MASSPLGWSLWISFASVGLLVGCRSAADPAATSTTAVPTAEPAPAPSPSTVPVVPSATTAAVVPVAPIATAAPPAGTPTAPSVCGDETWGGYTGTAECKKSAAKTIKGADRRCKADSDCVLVGGTCGHHGVSVSAKATYASWPHPCINPAAGVCPEPLGAKCDAGCCVEKR